MLLTYLVLTVKITVVICGVTMLNPEFARVDGIEECMLKILEANPESRTVIVMKNTTNYLLNSLYPAVVFKYNNDFSKMHIFEKFHMFIFLLQTIEEMNNILQQFLSYHFWNSRAKFIVAFTEYVNVELAFTICWHYYIYNVVLITDYDLKLYTYYPYNEENCRNIKAQYLTTCSNTTFRDYFPEKIHFDLHGCDVKLVALYRPPFVINVSEKDHASAAGFEVAIMNTIVERLNLTANYITNPYKDWGAILPNGTVTMMYRMLQEKEADIMFGGAYAFFQLPAYLDALVCHSIQTGIWWVPMAQEIPIWQNLIMLFSPWLWSAILIIFLVVCFVSWFIAINVDLGESQQLSFYTLISLSILLQISVAYPKSKILKTVFFIWSGGSLLIATAYQSELISVLTNPMYEKQIKTMDDILSSGMQYGFHHGAASLFDSRIYKEKRILDNYVSCSLGLECANRTAFKRDFAVLKNDKQTIYWISRIWTKPNGRIMLYGVHELGFTALSRIYTTKGFPLLERMNKVLFGLMENGLVRKWVNDMKYVSRQETSDDGPKALTISHLQTAFYILVFGILISTCVFFGEICAMKLESSKKRKC